MIRIGIDLGGTKTEIIALDPSGTELARRRIPSPRDNYDSTVRMMVELVHWIETAVGTRGTVGVGIPGAISPRTGLVKNANSTWLIGRPLDRDLSQALERPVRLQNDANCLAVSEATDGAGAGQSVVYAVILGTGSGSGIVVNSQIVTGRNAIAGEWAHNPLPWPRDDEQPGPACYCGRSGCLETWISGIGMADDHQRVTGERLSAMDISELAEGGDAAATATLDRYVDRLARGLAGVVNILDPDVIVLGGGVSNIARLYRDLPSRLSGLCFSDGVETPVVPARHGDSSGIRGAAWLWRPGETA